jgi:hypothetical protein
MMTESCSWIDDLTASEDPAVVSDAGDQRTDDNATDPLTRAHDAGEAQYEMDEGDQAAQRDGD